MYRENYITSLRAEMVEMVKNYLSPTAMAYGYSDVPLESTIKWRPIVLILGNYSSGKSTLINELIGADIQAVGQAPTDDSFTIITADEDVEATDPPKITEERDGKFLLNDPEYPFEILKKHGHRFTAHFKLKKVNSSFLKNFALIDTPGMLDSLSERDRGYNYQDVIGDLAQLADLVLVLFDPHKAGTIREAHTSLRKTISMRTFEDRVLFVLNRIDECASLSDLLQVYGTLCWNLSQITGRKDIPAIHLTYSVRAAKNTNTLSDSGKFLSLLENERKKLIQAILDAPRRRLDNLASFIETHAERLDLFTEILLRYGMARRNVWIRLGMIGIIIGLCCGSAAFFAGMWSGLFHGIGDPLTISATLSAGAAGFLAWMLLPGRYITTLFNKRRTRNIDSLTVFSTQTQKDTWQIIRPILLKFLNKTSGKFSLAECRKEYESVHRVLAEGTREVRKALNELNTLRDDDLLFLPANESEKEIPRNGFSD